MKSGVAIAALAVLVLCTTAHPKDAFILRPVWVADLDLVSEAHVIDGIALVYVAEEGDLYLVAVEVETGEERWRQRASPGETPLGEHITPRSVNGYPVYFRPQDDIENLLASLVIADPESGEDLAATAPWFFYSQPMACNSDPGAVCVQARESRSPDDVPTWFRTSLSDGGVLWEEDFIGLASNSYSRTLGPHGLFGVGGGYDEHLALYESGSEVWNIPVGSFFGDGYNSRGQLWSYHEEADLYVGSLALADAAREDPDVFDYSEIKMAAIGRSTGEVIWIEEGVSNLCGNSLVVLPESSSQTVHGYVDPIPVRCRTEGVLLEGGGGHKIAETILEGYDPKTGESLWASSLAGFPPVFGQPLRTGEPLIRADATGIVVAQEEERRAIDLLAGSSRPVSGEFLWCGSRLIFGYEGSYDLDDNENPLKLGGQIYRMCDETGLVIDGSGREPTYIPMGVGVRAGELILVSSGDGLMAYGQAA